MLVRLVVVVGLVGSLLVGVSGAAEAQVVSAPTLLRDEITEGESRRFVIAGVPRGYSRYFVQFKALEGYTASAGDVVFEARADYVVSPGQSGRVGPLFGRSGGSGSVGFRVEAVDDGVADPDETFGVRLCSAFNCGSGAVLGDWTVTIRERAADVVLSGTGVSVGVSGGSTSMLERSVSGDGLDTRDSVTITVASAPTADIVVVGDVAQQAPVAVAGGGTEMFPVAWVASEGAVFTTTDTYPASVVLEISARDNTVDTAGGSLSGTVTWTVLEYNAAFIDKAAGSPTTPYTGISVPDVAFTVTDDDPTSVEVLALATPDASATEGDSSDTAGFRLRLGRALVAGESLTVPVQPIGGVLGADFSLALSGSPQGVSYAAAASGFGEVTFTGPSAREAALVVGALADADEVSESVLFLVAHRSNEAGPRFLRAGDLAGGACSGIRCPHHDTLAAEYRVRLWDTSPGLRIAATDGAEVAENGGELSYEVSLAAAPEAGETVTVAVSSGNTSALTVTAGASLSFTAADWSTPQQITVQGVNDTTDTANRQVTVAHAVSNNGGTSYSTASDRDVVVRVVDDDATTITLSGGGTLEEAPLGTGWIPAPSEVMVEGDASRADVLMVSLGRELVAGEFVRVPLVVEALENGSRVAQLSGREPRTSANVAWPPRFNDVTMAASGVGVSFEHVDARTPPGTGYRVVTFAGAGAQTATVRLAARGGFDDGETADDDLLFSIYPLNLESDPHEALLAQLAGGDTSNLGGGLMEWQPRAVGAAYRMFRITDDDDPVVGADWPLLPDGVGPGDKFRLIYVTSATTAADRPDAAFYDQFARDEITGNTLRHGGVAALAPYAAEFKAVISAKGAGETVPLDGAAGHARFGAAVTSSSSDYNDVNAAVYWVNGAKVADTTVGSGSDFTDGTWDDETNPKYADGRAATASTTGYWTGSAQNGTAAPTCTAPGRPNRLVAGEEWVAVGHLNNNSSTPLGAATAAGTSTTDPACIGERGALPDGSTATQPKKPLYALSSAFTVEAGVTIDPASASEGGNISFTVTLPADAASPVTVPYTLTDGRGVSTDPAHSVATGSADGTSADYNNTAGNVTIATGNRTGTITVATTQDDVYEADHYLTVILGTPTGTDPPALSATRPTAVGTITDAADQPSIGVLGPSNFSAEEDAGTHTVTLRKTGTTLVPASVTWFTRSNTAISGEDFEGAEQTITFGPSETDKTVTVTIIDDESPELTETFFVAQLTDFVDAQRAVGVSGVVNSQILSIRVSDPPTITIAAANPITTEGDPATFTITASTAPAYDMLVSVQVAETGAGDHIAATDETTHTVTIAQGEMSAEFLVDTQNDNTAEPHSQFTASIPTPTHGGYTPHPQPTATATTTIQDNDTTPLATVASSAHLASEAGGERTARITVVLSALAESNVDVGYTVSGTATAGSDYAALPGTVRVPAGKQTAVVEVTVLDDVLDENTETVVVRLDDAAAYDLGSIAQVTVSIIDDDAPPTAVALSVAPAVISEGGGTATVTVIATVLGATRFAAAQTVSVSVAASGAQGVVGVSSVSDFNVVIPARARSGSATFTLTPTDNNVAESPETLNVTGVLSGAEVVAARLFVVDDDGPTSGQPSAQVVISAGEIHEGATAAVAVLLDRPLPGTTPVRLPLTVAGGYAAAESDLWASEVVIAPGARWGSAVLYARPDRHDESNEAARVQLDPVHQARGVAASVPHAAVTVIDATPTPIYLEVERAENVEIRNIPGHTPTHDRSVFVKLGRALAAGETVSVPLVVAGSDASVWAPAFLGGTASGITLTGSTLNFTAGGDQTATVILAAAADDDTINDIAEIMLGEPTTTGLAGGARALGRGLRSTVDYDAANDAAAIVSLRSADVTVTEGPSTAGHDWAQFDVVLSTRQGPLTANVCAVNGTAERGVHFMLHDGFGQLPVDMNGCVSAQVGAGRAFAPVTLLGSNSDDNVDAPNRTLTVTMTVPSLPANVSTGITEIDALVVDDDPTVVSLSGGGSIVEGDTSSSADVTVQLGRPLVAGETVEVPLLLAEGSGAVLSGASRMFSLAATGTGVVLRDGATAAPRLIFADAGAATATLRWTATASGDTDADAASEQFAVVVGNLDAAGLATNVGGGAVADRTAPAAVVTVVDDDAPAGMSVSPVSVEVTEGGSAGSYEVWLSADPGGEVTVTPASGDAGAVSVGAALTFDSTNWSEKQSVTVTPVSDADDADESVTVTHTVAGYGAVVSGPSVTVTVVDDDTAGVTVTESDDSTTVSEASGDDNTDTYTVVLDSRPTHPVTVTVTSATPGAATVNAAGGTPGASATLTFAPTMWNMPQTVTVTGVSDDVDQTLAGVNDGDGQVPSRLAKIGHAAASTDPDYVIADAGSVDVTVVDDDTAGVSIAESDDSTTVSEALGADNTDTYTVVLDSRPAHPVTVRVTSATPAAVKVNAVGGTPGASAVLTFAPSAWNTPQTVTVSGVDDDVDQAMPRTVTITHAAASTDMNYRRTLAVDSVEVTVADDDEAGVSVSPVSVEVTEGGSAGSYEVWLRSDPGGEVTVTPASGDVGAVSVGAALEFDSTNWSEKQTVSVSPVNDADASDESVTVTHTVAGYGTVVSGPSVTVTVDDHESLPTVSLSISGGGTATEGDSLTLTATLSAAISPPAAVTIPLARVAGSSTAGRSDVGLPAQIEVASGQLMATATLEVIADGVDEADEVFTVGLGSDYRGVRPHPSAGTASLTITDADPTTVILNAIQATATEGLRVTGDDGVPVVPAQYTASQLGEISVYLGRALAAGEQVTVPLEFGGDGTASDFVLSLRDSPLAGVSLSGTVVTFSGGSGTNPQLAVVRLLALPDADAANDVVTVSLGTVTATGLDGGVEARGTALITVVDRHGGSADRTLLLKSADTVIEERRPPSFAPFFVRGGALFTAVLSSGSGPVGVRICATDGTAVFGTDYAFESGTAVPGQTGRSCVDLDIGPGLASAEVRVLAPDFFFATEDEIDEPDKRFTVAVSLPSPVVGVSVSTTENTLTGIVEDDDPTSVSLSGGGTITEGDTTSAADVTVQLGRALVAGEVLEVPLVLSSTTGATLSGSTAAFTISKKSGTGVTLSGATTASPTLVFSGTGARTAVLAFTASSRSDDDTADESVAVSLGGLDANGLATNIGGGASADPDASSATLTITDSNSAGVSISETNDSTSVTEAAGGRTDTYSVVLDTQPTHSVVVTATSGTPAAAAVSTGGGSAGAAASLTFSTSNWDSPQTVTVHGVDDSADQGASQMVVISHAATSTDTDYVIADAGSVDVTVVDDDATVVSLGVSSSSVAEGASVSVSVSLSSAAPTGGVVVPVQRRAAGSTAEAADYTLAASVTVAAGSSSGMATLAATDDSIDEGASETLVIELGTLPTGYVAGATSHQTITITDNDSAGVSISETNDSTSVTEAAGGRTDTYTVVLDTQPTHPVMVAATSDTPGAATVSGPGGTAGASATLTFSTSNWDSPQTVTVHGVDDSADQGASRMVVISHAATSTDTNYVIADVVSVSVTVVDDDATEVSLGVSSSSVAEGASVSVTVSLSSAAPTGGVSVPVQRRATGSTAGTADYTLAASVSVAAGSSSGSATLMADDDDIDEGASEVLVIELGTLPTGYVAGATAHQTLTITDNDSAGVSISETNDSTSVTEAAGGRTDSYTVVLDSQPTHSVVVTATSGTPAAAAVSTGGGSAGAAASLTFSTSNWDSPQTVTVHGVDDSADQGASQMVVISHAATSTDTDYVIADAGSVDVTVVDDDATVVSLGVSSSSVAEGGSVSVSVSLSSAAPTGGVVVPVQRRAAGSTAEAADYTLAASVTVAAGSSSGMATLAATDDDIDEGVSETLIIELGTLPSGYVAGATSHQTITITDNDSAGVSISETSGSTAVTEAAGGPNSDTYTVVLDSQPTHEVTVTVTAGAGVLVDGPDLGSTGTRVETLTFSTSNWNSAQTVKVYGDDDNIDQAATRTVTITHAASSTDPNYGSSRNIEDVDVTVTDDDSSGVTITPSGGSTAVTEAAGPGNSDTYSVVLDSQPTHPVMVTATSDTPGAATVSVGGGAAGASATLTFSTSNWNSAQTVTVFGVDDAVDQVVPQSVVISHAATSTDTNYSLADAGSVVVTVADDDSTVVSLGVSSSSVAEGASVTLSVSLSAAAPPGGAVVPVQRRALGSTAVAADYTLAGSVTVAAGSMSGSATLAATDDSIDEGASEVLVVELGALPAGFVAGVPASVAVTIVDDDDPPVVPGGEVPMVSVAGAPGVEEGEAAVFTLTASPLPTAPVVVTVSVAQHGSFLDVGEGQHKVTVGVSGTATLSMATVDDSVDEGRGAVLAALVDGVGYEVDSDASQASVWVNDNDDPPQVAPISVVFDVVDSALVEGDSADSGSVRLKLSRSLGAGETLNVDLDRTNVDAGVWAFALAGSPAGVSYDTSAARLTFTGPSAPREAAVTVTAAAGSVDGSAGGVRAVPFAVASVSGVEGAQGQIGDEHAQTLYISDSAATGPVLDLSAHANQDRIVEGGILSVLFTLSEKRTVPTVVRFEVAGWGQYPTQPGDLGDPWPAKWIAADSQWELVIAAGSLWTGGTLRVLDDQVPDGDKMFAVRIASVSSGVRVGRAERVVIARDTSPDPEIVMRYRAVFDNDDLAATTHPDCAGDDTATTEAAYTVRLNKQPEPGRTVHVDIFDRADLTRKQIKAITDDLGHSAFNFNAPHNAATVDDNWTNSLRVWFYSDDWDQPQTVTVEVACAAAQAGSAQIWHRTQAHPTPRDPLVYRQILIEHPEHGWIRAARFVPPPITHQPVHITATG